MGNGSQVTFPNPKRKPPRDEDGVKMAMVLADEGEVAGKLSN